MTNRLIAVLLCFAVAFLVYIRTLAPTVYTFDSAEFATGAYTLGIIHATGYPFYLLLARLFQMLPVGDPAYRVNLMSAFWGAVTIALLCLICHRLTHRVLLSAAASLLFAFSFYYWREAVIAETYTLNTALLCILILLALQEQLDARALGIAGLVLGLSFANHMSTLLALPALAYWGMLRRRSGLNTSRSGLNTSRSGLNIFSPYAVLGVLIGLLFYLYLPIRYAADPPLNYAKMYFDVDLTTPAGVWSWMTGAMFRAYMGGYDLPSALGEVGAYAGMLWTNFIGAGALLGVIGLVQMLRRETSRGIFFVLLYLAYTLFFINYRVVNKDTMFSASYLVWTIWIAYGAAHALERPARRLLAPALVGLLAVAALAANFAWVDQSSNYQPAQFTGQLLRDVAPSAFIVTEWTWATPLEYYQIVEKRRPDVTLFDRGLYGLAIWNRARAQHIPDPQALEQVEQAVADRIRAEIAQHPVYATEYDEGLAPYFDFVPQDRYFRLMPRGSK